jgi:hypothetical protein
MKTPERLVQEQVDAYNARDLEAFLAVYAEEVVILNDGQEKRLDKATLRERYGKLFRENPGLRCEILKREVAGNIVVDDEHVDGLADGAQKKARATYEIEGGLIRRISFTRL